jgi:4-hydroxy-tetrahydrodipicolinate reductase
MRYRVVQWATGAVGTWSLKQIIDRPELDLVGVWVHSEDKDGRDAGEIAGRPATGVRATRSRDEILALDADVVIHCGSATRGNQQLPFDDDVVALLSSGKNVISVASYFSPRIEGPDRMRRLEAACAKGGTTLFGAGIDPGFVCDRVPALLTGMSADVEKIRMVESYDPSRHPIAEFMITLGFGKRPEELSLESDDLRYWAERLFPAPVHKLARLLGIELDKVELGGPPEFAFATQDLKIGAGEIGKGTISGLNYEYIGYRDGNPFITHRWVHYVEREGVPDHWLKAPQPTDDEAIPYQVNLDIDGRPSLHTEMIFTDPEDTVWLPTAAVAVRAIPEVVAARTGFFEEPVFGTWKPPRKP